MWQSWTWSCILWDLWCCFCWSSILGRLVQQRLPFHAFWKYSNQQVKMRQEGALNSPSAQHSDEPSSSLLTTISLSHAVRRCTPESGACNHPKNWWFHFLTICPRFHVMSHQHMEMNPLCTLQHPFQPEHRNVASFNARNMGWQSAELLLVPSLGTSITQH
jgi:hypothetical protein